MDLPLAGRDPYDALRGTRIPDFVKQHARLRQLVIQIRKRTPFDLGSFIGVTPFVMAKAVAGFLSGHARVCAARGESVQGLPKAEALVRALMDSDGCLGSGAWGYEFDVQTRWGYYPAGSPNIIATVFVGNALLEAGIVFDRSDWVELACSASKCLRQRFLAPASLHETPVFRYTEDTDRVVHNANLLGAGFVAVVAALEGDSGSVSMALNAALFSARRQDQSGRWSYGDGPDLRWADNFHTAYDLRGAAQVLAALPDPELSRFVDAGVSYWVEHFFGVDGRPYYFDDASGPLDVHCGATGVEVAALLALEGYPTSSVCSACERWMSENLVGPDGATRYQIRGRFRDSRHFVRWGDAHWAAGKGAEELMNHDVAHPVSKVLGSMARGGNSW